jgi:hypothetical protein
MSFLSLWGTIPLRHTAEEQARDQKQKLKMLQHCECLPEFDLTHSSTRRAANQQLTVAKELGRESIR